MASSLVCCLVFWLATPLLAQESGICSRTLEVRGAIVEATGAATCTQVEQRHLRDVTSLDLSDQGITSLSVGDFAGLHSLKTLDLSGNSLTSLPSGLFNQLSLLRTLHLHDNGLTTLPDDVFDQLLFLQTLTLHDNAFASLPDGLLEELRPLDRYAANGNAPTNSGAYPRLQRFIDRHGITTPEEFIAALPAEYRQRFVMSFESASPAADHVSKQWPRILSFGYGGRFTFAWNNDPDAPSMFRDSVEFLRQNESDWTAGVVDFSGDSPRIIEPSSCQSCHSTVNKPLWGGWSEWAGTEFKTNSNGTGQIQADPLVHDEIRAAVNKIVASTDSRLSLLDFSASAPDSYHERRLKSLGGGRSMLLVELAGAIWSLRHAEVLHGMLRDRNDSDFSAYERRTVCLPNLWNAAEVFGMPQFSQPIHNLAILANRDDVSHEPGHLAPFDSSYAWMGYKYHAFDDVFDALVFLMATDVWRNEPIVKRLYRNTPNTGLIDPNTSFHSRTTTSLYYPAGSATAEDELLQKLRIHFGNGTKTMVEARALQNEREGTGMLSASFKFTHNSTMIPQICDALTDSAPTELSVTADDDDAVLRWESPVYDSARITGYRILRGGRGSPLSVHVADTGSNTVTWTDEGVSAHDGYTYAVQAIYDDYYPGSESAAFEFSIPLTATTEQVPASHDGKNAFTFELHFNQEPALSYRTLRDSAFSATNGTIVSAKRLTRGSNQGWGITVRPDTDNDVTIVLPPTTDCAATGAVCTAAGERMSDELRVVVPQALPLQMALTARADDVPSSHNGTSGFTFTLHFNRAPSMSYRTMRDSAFTVTGGTITRAARLIRHSNLGWRITVQPNSSGPVVLTLPPTSDCTAAGAVCASDGTSLSGTLRITIAADDT